jgi:APA family basic amino acid/polyamine antiporter
VGSSIYYALGVVALSALGLTPAVLMLSGIFFLFTGLSYAEGAAALPESGGSGAFARRAFNDLLSFISSWVLMMDYVVTISISAFSAANYMGFFFPLLKTWPTNSFVGILLIAILMLVNIRGVRGSSRLNMAFIIVDIVTQGTMAILGVFLIISLPQLLHNVHWGVAPTTNQLLFGISISMVAYTGIETISNLGGETKDPGRKIPKTLTLVFFTVIALYSLLSMTAFSAYPVHQAAGGQWVTDLTQQYLQNPVMGIAQAMPEFIRPYMSFWVAILAVTILIIATNAGILGASRLAYFMSVRHQLPQAVARVHPKYHVPTNAIIIFCALGALLITTGQVTVLVDLYAFGAMLAYTFAHASIIALRVKEPNMPRPFKIPLNIRIRKKEIPITAILGGLATSGTWFVVVFTHEIGRIVGFAWIIVGLTIYILYRRFTKRPIIARSDK